MAIEIAYLESVLEALLALGAHSAEVLLSEHSDVEVSSTPTSRPQLRRSQDGNLTLRAWRADGAMATLTGYPSTGKALAGKLMPLLEKAEPKTFQGPVERYPELLQLDVNDRRYKGISDEDRIELLLENERAVNQADRRVRPERFTYRDRLTHRVLLNTRGASHERTTTSFLLEGTVKCRAKRDTILLSDRMESRSYATVSVLPFGTLLARRAAELIQLSTVALSGPTRILLPPRAHARLINWLAERVRDESLKAGSTFLSDGVSFHRRIHIVDDGALPGGLRTRGFDDEGVPAQALTILREGLFDARYRGLRDARIAGVRPTGHAQGGTLKVSNLQFSSGTRSMNAHLGEQDQLVFRIDDFPDLSGIDPKTGAFDLTVSGHVFQKQENTGAARNVRITGQLSELLRDVYAITSDTDRHEHVDAPGIFLDGATIG